MKKWRVQEISMGVSIHNTGLEQLLNEMEEAGEEIISIAMNTDRVIIIYCEP